MGKKSRKETKRNLDDKVVEFHSKQTKENEISKLIAKIKLLGLGIYETEMKELDTISNQYINKHIECRKTINLVGSNRKMDIKFLNNKKYPISINLLYDKNI